MNPHLHVFQTLIFLEVYLNIGLQNAAGALTKMNIFFLTFAPSPSPSRLSLYAPIGRVLPFHPRPSPSTLSLSWFYCPQEEKPLTNQPSKPLSSYLQTCPTRHQDIHSAPQPQTTIPFRGVDRLSHMVRSIKRGDWMENIILIKKDFVY